MKDVLTPDDVHMVYGTEVEKSMKLTKGTKKILRELQKKGFVKFEYDDSVEDYDTLNQIKDIADTVGYEVWEKGHAILIVRE